MSGTVPTTAVSLGNTGNNNSIVKVFGTGTNPTLLSTFRGKTNLEPGPQPPVSGAISMSAFKGQSVLQPPSSITMTGATTAGGTLSWTKPSILSALSNYTYYVGTSSGGSNVLATTTTTSNNASVSLGFSATLAGNTSYYVSVLTKNNGNGVSAVSTTGALAFPGAATSISAPDSTGRFTWSAPTGTAPSSYTVVPYTNGSGGTSVTGLTSSPYAPSGVTMNASGSQYYYTIAAINTVGSSTATGAALNIPPAPPTALTLTTAGLASWTAPANLGGTALTYSATLTTNASTSNATGLTTTSKQFTALQTGTLSYFTVQASNAGGAYGSSRSSNLTNPFASTSLVSFTWPDPQDPATAYIVWNAIPNASSYAWYFQDQDRGSSGSGTVSTASAYISPIYDGDRGITIIVNASNAYLGLGPDNTLYNV